MTDLQSALTHRPGKNCAVALFSRKDGISDQALKQNIASLMKCFEATNTKPDNLHILVGIDPELIDQPTAAAILPKRKGQRKMPSTQEDVMIQVAGMTETDMIFALRVSNAILSASCECETEIIGAQLRYNQEPFGFYHESQEDLAHLNEVARISSGDLEGGSWLLYQLYRQKLSPFYDLTLEQQAQVMGAESVAMSEEEISMNTFPDNAHTKVTKSPGPLPQMIRRGFAYRKNGHEGTAFIAASNEFENFSTVLDKMLDRDALLGFAKARQGGVYFAPPNGDWLDCSAPTPAIPNDAKYLPLHMQPNQQGEIGSLIDYTTTQAFVDYINMLVDLGLFEGPIGNQTFNADAKTLLNAINAVLSGGDLVTSPVVDHQDPDKVAELEALTEEAMRIANRLNTIAKYYMTAG